MTDHSLIHGHKAISPPVGVLEWDVDPYDAGILTDPLPFFRELHARAPFAYVPKYRMLACGGYDVTREVFSDHDRFVSSRGVGLSDFKLEKPWRPPSIVLEVDPPDHNRTRRVIMRALSPKVVRDLRDAFNSDAEALVEDVLSKGEIDAVVEIAEAFPTRVFPRAVGIKEPDARMLIDYGAMVFNALGPDNELRRAALAKGSVVGPWVNEACKRRMLTEDGIGAIIHQAADTGDLTEAEAEMLVRSLLSAGVDTTVTGIGNALMCLAQNPSEWDKLKADPEKFALPAFEETLRYTSPVQAFCRTANQDTEVGGVPIEEGTKILCVLGAANLDPAHWDNPETFDISRQAAGHLALGVGIHVCVGQNIARAEGQAILRAIARRVDRIELVGDPVWRPNNAMHALDRLPLRLIPA